MVDKQRGGAEGGGGGGVKKMRVGVEHLSGVWVFNTNNLCVGVWVARVDPLPLLRRRLRPGTRCVDCFASCALPSLIANWWCFPLLAYLPSLA